VRAASRRSPVVYPAGPAAELAGPEGYVILSPAGVRVCAAALRIVTGVVASRGAGAVPPSGDLELVREVLRLAQERAAGCAPATEGERFVIDLPASDGTVTVAQAAEIRGVSPQAIRKAIKAGKLPARRQGSQWAVQEQAVREAAGRRRRARS
jgi:excisionase family DNA binding protein